MEITIEYSFDGNMTYPCCATTTVLDQRLLGSGETYEQARDALIKKVALCLMAGPVPETEVVEIRPNLQ